MSKELKFGIMPREQYQKHILDIAAGRKKVNKDDPKIWFNSMKSFSEVLSDKNLQLLGIIKEAKPKSLKDLAELSGRHVSNLSRTLKTMERYGILELKRDKNSVEPILKASQFVFQAGLSTSETEKKGLVGNNRTKRDDLIDKYASDLREKCGVTPDMDFLTKVTIGCGPAIYNKDSSRLSDSDKNELATVKNNFLIKKLGLADGPELDEAIDSVLATYGRSNPNKQRPVIYYLLAKVFGKESIFP